MRRGSLSLLSRLTSAADAVACSSGQALSYAYVGTPSAPLASSSRFQPLHARARRAWSSSLPPADPSASAAAQGITGLSIDSEDPPPLSIAADGGDEEEVGEFLAAAAAAVSDAPADALGSPDAQVLSAEEEEGEEEGGDPLLLTPTAQLRRDLFHASKRPADFEAIIQRAEREGLADTEFRSFAVMFMSVAIKYGYVRKADVSGWRVFQRMFQEHCSEFDSWNERQLTRFLGSLAKTGVSPFTRGRLLTRERVHAKIYEHLSRMNTVRVLQLLTNLYVLDLRPTPDLYRSVLDRLTVAGGPAMTDGKMGSALFAMKRLQGMYALSPQADHLDYFITHMLSSTENIRVWRWVELMSDLSLFRYRPRDDILDLIVERIDAHVANLRALNFGMLMRSFAQLSYWPPMKVMDHLMSSLDPFIAASLKPTARPTRTAGAEEPAAPSPPPATAGEPDPKQGPRQVLNATDAFELITSLAHIHYYPGKRRMQQLIALLDRDRSATLAGMESRHLAALLWAYGRLLHRGDWAHIAAICQDFEARLAQGERISSGSASCALRGICTLSLYTRFPELTSLLAMSTPGTMDREQGHTQRTLISRLALLVSISLFDSHPAVTLLLDRIVRGPLDGLDHSSLLRLGVTVEHLHALSPHGGIYARMLKSNAALCALIEDAKEVARTFNKNLAAGVDPVVATRAQQLSAGLTLLGVRHEPSALFNAQLMFYEALVPLGKGAAAAKAPAASSRVVKKQQAQFVGFRFYDDPHFFCLHEPRRFLRGERIGFQAIRLMVYGISERLLNGPQWDAMRAEHRVALLRRELGGFGVLPGDEKAPAGAQGAKRGGGVGRPRGSGAGKEAGVGRAGAEEAPLSDGELAREDDEEGAEWDASAESEGGGVTVSGSGSPEPSNLQGEAAEGQSRRAA